MEIDLKKDSKNIPSLNKTYQLSALINVDSFFYALLDHENLIYSQEVNLREQSNLSLFEGRNLSINRARIGVYNDKYTLIPASEYDEKIRDTLLEYAIGTTPDIHVFADYNSLANVYICYSISADLYERCADMSENQQINHVVSALLTNILNESAGTTLIHLCKIGDQALLICMVDGSLKLVTNLRGSSPMRLLYYTNLLKEQFGLTKSKVFIELSGGFQDADGSLRLLQKYFSNVSYKEASFVFNMVGMKSSRHYPLKSIAECA